MFTKTLIRCPKCESEGRTKTIGLLFSNGMISVQREFTPAKGDIEPKRDYTIINGKDFSLICGFCGEEVYRKEVSNESTNHGSIRFYGETLVQTFIKNGLGSVSAFQGTS